MRFSEKLHKQDFIDAPFDKLDGFFKSAHLLVSGDVRFDLQFDQIIVHPRQMEANPKPYKHGCSNSFRDDGGGCSLWAPDSKMESKDVQVHLLRSQWCTHN